MDVRLLFKDRSLDTSAPLPFGAEDLAFDLELETVFSAMAEGDPIIARAVRTTVLQPLTDREAILYRQRTFKDCLAHPAEVRELYSVACEALRGRKPDDLWDSSDYAPSIFATAVEILGGYLGSLRRLRDTAERCSRSFSAEGFTELFKTLHDQIDNAFLKEAAKLLEDLQFKDGIVVGMRLGADSRTCDYTLLRQNPQKAWLKWKLAPSYTPGARDYGAIRDLNNRRDRAMASSVNVLADAAGHITDFLNTLREELAVYVGALNLYETLKTKGVPLCMPEFCAAGVHNRSFYDLRDMSLCLSIDQPAIGNRLNAENKLLYLITGANQGGKTTFLRSLGQSQLMAQAGLFVAAQSDLCPICSGLFTHFGREEDNNMHSGKLDEELSRMDQIVPHLSSDALVLFNESFASTNEREGSELCYQIAQALTEHGIEAFFVTHLFAFSQRCYREVPEKSVFLRAQRLTDGSRTFELEEGQPLQTAFGQDLYHKMWG